MTIDIIKNLCKEKNTSLTALCKNITGSTGNYTTWKKGNIRNDYLLKIAEYFNVSTDYLLTGKEASADDLKAADPLRKELLNIAKGLSEENQKALLAMAKSLKESSQQKK